MPTPTVSVVLPVYNGERYLAASIKSILRQTLEEFELLVVDDGSVDRSAAIAQSFGDPRIRYLGRPQRGIVAALNDGFALARGEFIARMDADDVAYPVRLRTQVDWLRRHPDVGLLGTACHAVDENNQWIGWWRWPETDLEIRWFSLLGCPFAHPTMMIRRQCLDTHGLAYRDTYPAVEDYDLWRRVLDRTQGANLSQALLRYRVHGSSTTTLLRDRQWDSHARVAHEVIRQVVPEADLTAAQVGELVRAFIGWKAVRGNRAPQLSPLLVRRYMTLFEQFVSRQGSSAALRRWYRRDRWKMLSQAVRSKTRRGWVGIVLRHLLGDPGMVFLPITEWLGQYRARRLARAAATEVSAEAVAPQVRVRS